jgi:hypothetical protein
MARARPLDNRSRSKSTLIEEVSRGIEQFQDVLSSIEDFSREGFPYRDAARAKAELQLRECVRRIFGERSPEFQTYRNYKLRTGNKGETAQSMAVVKQLIHNLEDRKLELQGLKPPAAEPVAAPAPSPPPAPPPMSLVPPVPESRQVAAAPLVPSAPMTVSVAMTTNLALPPAAAKLPDPPTPIPAATTAPPVPDAAQAAATGRHRPPTETVLPPVTAPPEAPALPAAQSCASIPASSPVVLSAASPEPPPAESSTPAPPPAPASPPPAPEPAAVIPPSPLDSSPAPKEPPAAAPIAPAAADEFTPRIPATDQDTLELIRKVCIRFHAVTRQLRLRKDYRPTLEVEDDHDLQDLLCALLKVEFDEVGIEEWTPPYGQGAPSRGFLVNHDHITVVAKKTRPGLTTKEVAEQIASDSAYFGSRSTCRTLFCFIYDPEGRIGSPKRLETDLTSVSDRYTIEVLVAPK